MVNRVECAEALRLLFNKLDNIGGKLGNLQAGSIEDINKIVLESVDNESRTIRASCQVKFTLSADNNESHVKG